eukprot:365509-Chlamydomonas_euryale.AAC.26
MPPSPRQQPPPGAMCVFGVCGGWVGGLRRREVDLIWLLLARGAQPGNLGGHGVRTCACTAPVTANRIVSIDRSTSSNEARPDEISFPANHTTMASTR